MPKENNPHRLRLVEKEEVILCPKCSRKNQGDNERCGECSFPLKDAALIKIIPIEFLLRRR